MGAWVQIEPAGTDRRTFLKTAGVAAAAGTLTACANPEHILPLLEPDPRQEAGRPQFFATVCRECPAGCGMVARVNDGRTTKVEGNPDHPVNRGKLCLRGQTAVEGLYNPDRFQQPRLRDAHGNLRPVDWPTALARFEQEAAAAGTSIAWLGRLETGSMDAAIRAWLAARGAPPPIYYEHFSHDALRQAMHASYGRAVVPAYHLDRARFILSFGAEFLETWISNVEFAGDFAAAHSFGHTKTPTRFVAVSPRLSLTAANADEWWPAPPGSEAALAQALLELISQGNPRLDALAAHTGVAPDVLRRAAQRLLEHRPSLVLGPGYAGDTPAAAACWQIVNRINDHLGNTGVTVDPHTPHALSAVATQAGVLDQLALPPRLLLLHHANPVYDHPALAAALARVPFLVSFASWMDETTQYASLILPDHHFLESWGDFAPRPGVTGLLQPTRVPVFDTRATADLLLGRPFRPPRSDAELQEGVILSPAPSAAPAPADL